MNKGRFAVIIPVYNHEQRVADVVRNTLKLGFPVFVVDDGSTDATYDKIRNMAGISIIRHDRNRGKGAAIKTGFAAAAGISDWAITIDADGQHDPDNALTLIHAIPDAAMHANRRPIIIGMRENMAGDDVPWTSSFGREFSNFWVRASGGPAIKDSQSGFRIYPLPQCMLLNIRANRFQFEVEMLAKAGWNRFPVIEAPISVSYTPGTPRISHFRPFIDFVRNSGTFMWLIFQRILIPIYIRRKMSYKK
jgi:glycosyltransferase involved in cell wall biosynthesis